MKNKYAIEFNWGGSSRSWTYFDSTPKKAKEAAAEAATAYIEKYNNSFRMFSFIKNPRVVTVKEYDTVNKCTKRGGEKFKLHITYCQATTNLGTKLRTEWYEAVD